MQLSFPQVKRRKIGFQEAFDWINYAEKAGGLGPRSLTFPRGNETDYRVGIRIDSRLAFTAND